MRMLRRVMETIETLQEIRDSKIPPRLYVTCKWGHNLDDAIVYNRVRYCRVCREERHAYNWYKTKCKRARVVDGVITWNQWAKDLWGGPYKRERI
jgi:hypothetical protein